MPTELVLLSDVEVTPDHVGQAAGPLQPGATWMSYRGGELGQLVSADGRPLLTVFASRPVLERREVVEAVERPPASFALWTEVNVPYGQDADGRPLADALARVVGGEIRERA